MSTTTLPIDVTKLQEICRQNDVAMMAVFGSMARGEATKDSDVDLLVRFVRQKSLLALAQLALQIEAALGRPVDLLTEAAVHPAIRDEIQHDLKIIYGKI